VDTFFAGGRLMEGYDNVSISNDKQSNQTIEVVA
jgi:hypothetical protein